MMSQVSAFRLNLFPATLLSAKPDDGKHHKHGGHDPRGGTGDDPRGGTGDDPRGGTGDDPRGGTGDDPRGGTGDDPRG